MSANAELKYTSFMITYAMMRKKSAGKKLKCHLDLMLGISTELNFIFWKLSLEVSPLSYIVLQNTYFKKILGIIGRM